MRIAIDFDDVIFPYHDVLKHLIHRHYGVDLSNQKVTTFYYHHLAPLAAQGLDPGRAWELVEAAWVEKHLHDTAEPVSPETVPAIRRLRQRHRVEIVTARSEAARPLVEAFLERHGIEVDGIAFGRFEKVGYDVLVDDFPKHVVENARSGGHSLLFTIDENSTFDESTEPRVLRVNGWHEVEAAVRRLEGAYA